MAKFFDFFKMSSPKMVDHTDKYYKSLRMQTFLAGTLGYALYYVCRLSMSVMKQPLIDAGLLNAAQLGIISACLYWAYAAGKLVNGFLADSSNIKRFMAAGLIVSTVVNFLMGVMGGTFTSKEVVHVYQKDTTAVVAMTDSVTFATKMANLDWPDSSHTKMVANAQLVNTDVKNPPKAVVIGCDSAQVAQVADSTACGIVAKAGDVTPRADSLEISLSYMVKNIPTPQDNPGTTNTLIFILFAILWAVNGWSQSMGAPPAIIGLSRWFPLRIRGTFYGFFSASHNIGEGVSIVLSGFLIGAFGWLWGFFGAAIAGVVGVFIIIFFLHDTPESKGFKPIEVLSGEKSQEEYEAEMAAAEANHSEAAKLEQEQETKRIQAAVIRNPGVWILALSSAFMYMSRYAIIDWGVYFLQEVRGFSMTEAAAMIAINPIFGVIGTVFGGLISDVLFKGDRKYPAFVAGILETIALVLFLFGGGEKWMVVTSMVIFGIAIGVLIAFVGGLMAIDLVPRKATGAALGIVGMASYAATGIMNIVTGVMLDNNKFFNEAGKEVHDFTIASWFWIGAAVISFMLPVLNWRRKQAEI